MAEQNTENLDSQIEELLLEDDNGEVKTDDESEKSNEDIEKLKEINKQLYARAKKAEGFEFKDGKWVKPEIKKEKPIEKSVKEPEMSTKDLFYLVKNNVHEDDIDEVLEYAKFKKISVSEALSSPVIKNTLETKSEQRRVAEATHTGTSTRGTAKISDETIIEKANKGELPESESDMIRLVKARKGLK